VLLSEKISSIFATYTILSIATTVLSLSAHMKRIFGLLEMNFFVDENAERILCSFILLHSMSPPRNVSFTFSYYITNLKSHTVNLN